MANFENITIEKGMYQQKGKTLTDVLETLDPSENYKGTALSNLDAFSRQLKRFDIKVNGSGSDCVEKFFQSSDSAARTARSCRSRDFPARTSLPAA